MVDLRKIFFEKIGNIMDFLTILEKFLGFFQFSIFKIQNSIYIILYFLKKY